MQEAKAKILQAEGKLPSGSIFAMAVREAEAQHTLLTGDEASADFAAAAAQRAAANAANVNEMPRCRKCEACVNLLSSGRRRCLLVRAYAAAAAGHTGALARSAREPMAAAALILAALQADSRLQVVCASHRLAIGRKRQLRRARMVRQVPARR
jgi:hypothetical protein